MVCEPLRHPDGMLSQFTDVEMADAGVPIPPLEEDGEASPAQGMEGMGYDDAVGGNSMVALRNMRGPLTR